MMLELIRCRVLQLVRNREEMFWSLMFPIVLGTFFYFTFGGSMYDAELIDEIPVAVVVKEENVQSDNFIAFADEMTDILSTEQMIEKEALEQLEAGEVEGVFYTGETHSLTVAKSSLNTSILQSLLDNYNKHEAMIMEIAATHPENLEKALQGLETYESMTEDVTVGGKTFDVGISYFFALIAMACLYGCFVGERCPIDMQANLSALGARRSITPTHRLKLIIADMIASFGIHFLNTMVLLIYLKYVLKIGFGDKMGGMVAICFVGSLIGVALGMFVGSIGKLAEGAKVGVMLGVSMVCSFLSGLMIYNVKDIVEQKAPFINRINPAALISDALYCLNVYDDPQRFYRNMITLVAMSIGLILISFVMVRRERYDSI